MNSNPMNQLSEKDLERQRRIAEMEAKLEILAKDNPQFQEVIEKREKILEEWLKSHPAYDELIAKFGRKDTK